MGHMFRAAFFVVVFSLANAVLNQFARFAPPEVSYVTMSMLTFEYGFLQLHKQVRVY